jgi:hypothetical protein
VASAPAGGGKAASFALIKVAATHHWEEISSDMASNIWLNFIKTSNN